jgi:RNA polymerase sigma factor (sigma-70 family)
MTAMDDATFMANCDRLFESLNKRYLVKLGQFAHWSLEDFKQEFRLVCWEIARNLSGFDPASGNIQEYFVGRVRHLIYRAQGYCGFDRIDDMLYEDGSVKPNAQDRIGNADRENFFTASALDVLLKQEEARERHERECDLDQISAFIRKSLKKNWMQRMRDQGLSQQQIAEIGGVSQAHVSRTLKKAAGRPVRLSVR